MTSKAAAMKATLDSTIRSAFDRAKKWFKEYPDEPFCYWAKDVFISIADKDNKALLNSHPEIDDINDHTIVEFDVHNNTLYLSKFCPKLRQALKEMFEADCRSNTADGIRWSVFPHGDNFRIIAYEN
jgi:hypothetical protein